MPPLLEIQRTFADGMRTGCADAAALTVVSDRIRAEDRLRIYRNHYTVTLTEALEATYPVVRRLVGAPFFGWAASRYIAACPPQGPCLFEYGAGFSGLLAGLAACGDLPYLADVARYEWAINRAYHAPDAPSLEPATLAELTSTQMSHLTLSLDRSCALFASRYPVSRIWKANQPDADANARIDLGVGGERLLVCRMDDEVVWRQLGAGEFAFIGALCAGRTLLAANSTAAAAGDFDCEAALAALLAARSVTGFVVRTHQH